MSTSEDEGYHTPTDQTANTSLAAWWKYFKICANARAKRKVLSTALLQLLQTALETNRVSKLRNNFQEWMSISYTTHVIRRAVCSTPSTPNQLIRNWSASTKADPRTIIYNDMWPEDEEFKSIISVSKDYLMKISDDARTKDVQVRMESGRRIQLANAVFRQMDGGTALIAAHRKAIKRALDAPDSLRGEYVPPRIKKILALREKSQSRSAARRNTSSNHSDSASEFASAKADSEFVLDDQASDLSSILEEGLQASGDQGVQFEEEVDAASELARQVAGIEAARHAAESAAHAALFIRPNEPAVPSHRLQADAAEPIPAEWSDDAFRSAPPRGDEAILEAAAVANVDPRMHSLLLNTSITNQAQQYQAMLDRMAAMEQRLRDFQVSKTVPQPSTELYSQLPEHERRFNLILDKVTPVHWEDHQLAKNSNTDSCLDIKCNLLSPATAKFCQCSAPRSILQLRCQHPACGARCNGTVSEMLNQDICHECRAPMLYKLDAAKRAELTREYAKLGSTTGYDPKPPPDLDPIIPKEYRISEYENDVMMIHRRSDPDNVLAARAATAYKALSAIKMQSDIFSQAEVLGEEVDFILGIKAFLAAFKAMNFGEGLMAQIQDLIPSAGVELFGTFIQWTKEALKGKTPKVDWNAPDAASTFAKYLDFMELLIRKTAGPTFADDHKGVKTILMTAIKAAGRNNVNWSTQMAFKKYCSTMAWYHNMCIAWVSESPFFYDLYGEDVLWNHIGTDAQMPKFVIRYMKNNRGVFIKLLDVKYDRPARLALQHAAMELALVKHKRLPDIGKLGHEQPGVRFAADPPDTPEDPNAPLSTTAPTRDQFKRYQPKGAYPEMQKKNEFNWKHTDGHCRSVHFDLCQKCYKKGHPAEGCTNEAHKNAKQQLPTDSKPIGAYILDQNAFAKTVEKNPLIRSQWPACYITFRGLSREAAHANYSNLPKSGKVEGKGAAQAQKLKAILQGEAIPRKDIPQMQLSDLKAHSTVSEAIPPTEAMKLDYHQFPIIGYRKLHMNVPGVLPGTEASFSAMMLDRDEIIPTDRGLESKRCLAVQIFEQKKAESAPTFKKMRQHSIKFISKARHVRDAYSKLNHLTNVDQHINLSVSAHSDIASRNQALSPYFLKDTWLEEFGTGPIAVWTIQENGITELVIFILAADEERTSPLESVVSHIAAYLGHAYELRWDQPLRTLRELLHVVGRLHRAVDIALDLCTQMEDTLKGNPPVVPDYLSANESLSKLVRYLDGQPVTKMVGKTSIPQTLSDIRAEDQFSAQEAQLLMLASQFKDTRISTANLPIPLPVQYGSADEIDFVFAEQAAVSNAEAEIFAAMRSGADDISSKLLPMTKQPKTKFQMLVFNRTLSLLTMAKSNGNYEVPSVGIQNWQESAADFATSLNMKCVDIVQLVHCEGIEHEPDTTWIVLIVETLQNQLLTLTAPHVWDWVPIESAANINLQISNNCKTWIESLRQTSTEYLSDLSSHVEDQHCTPVASVISENQIVADKEHAVLCLWCKQELGTMAYLPGAFLPGQQGPSGFAQHCDHCWSRSAGVCREMLRKSSPIHCETFQLLIFNSEMSVLTTVDTSATANYGHTLPFITMRGWTNAASEFTESLGLQPTMVWQLMHPEDSGITPDVPWIVVTINSKQSQDRFSYQDLSSINLPHWAWVPMDLAGELLQMADSNRVKTSIEHLIICESDEAESAEMGTKNSPLLDDLTIDDPDLEIVWSHWLRFCARFEKPRILPCETLSQQTAAAEQAKLFLIYEIACFDIKPASIVAKLWKVGAAHKVIGYADPFIRNDLVKDVTTNMCTIEKIQAMSSHMIQAMSEELTEEGITANTPNIRPILNLAPQNVSINEQLYNSQCSMAEGTPPTSKLQDYVSVHDVADAFYRLHLNVRGHAKPKAPADAKARAFLVELFLQNFAVAITALAASSFLPDTYFIFFVTILVWLTGDSVWIFMLHYYPEVMHVPVSSHGSSNTSADSLTDHTTQVTDQINDDLSDDEACTIHHEHSDNEMCTCSDADGTNACILAVWEHAHNSNDGSDHPCNPRVEGAESPCLCECPPCVHRTQRITAVMLIDLSHLYASMLATAESSHFHQMGIANLSHLPSCNIHRWVLRCRFRALALLGMQRTHYMQDTCLLINTGSNAIRGFFPAHTKLWRKNKRMNTEQSWKNMFQWAVFELVHQGHLNMEMNITEIMQFDDSVFAADLTDPTILMWHRRRLTALVAIMSDHDCNTLNFDPYTQGFAECAVERMHCLSLAASWADRLLKAVQFRGLIEFAVVDHGSTRDVSTSAAVLMQFQYFADVHPGQSLSMLTADIHPLSAMMFNQLNNNLDDPPSKVSCLCCHIDFTPVKCSKQDNAVTIYCGLCWHDSKLACKSITDLIIRIQRTWRLARNQSRTQRSQERIFNALSQEECSTCTWPTKYHKAVYWHKYDHSRDNIDDFTMGTNQSTNMTPDGNIPELESFLYDAADDLTLDTSQLVDEDTSDGDMPELESVPYRAPDKDTHTLETSLLKVWSKLSASMAISFFPIVLQTCFWRWQAHKNFNNKLLGKTYESNASIYQDDTVAIARFGVEGYVKWRVAHLLPNPGEAFLGAMPEGYHRVGAGNQISSESHANAEAKKQASGRMATPAETAKLITRLGLRDLPNDFAIKCSVNEKSCCKCRDPRCSGKFRVRCQQKSTCKATGSNHECNCDPKCPGKFRVLCRKKRPRAQFDMTEDSNKNRTMVFSAEQKSAMASAFEDYYSEPVASQQLEQTSVLELELLLDLYYAESETPQQDDFISEEHKRPKNALQHLAITYFMYPELEAKTNGTCLDTSCTLRSAATARYCQCGVPRSTSDMKCQALNCGTKLIGTIEEMLSQEMCYECHIPLTQNSERIHKAVMPAGYHRMGARTKHNAGRRRVSPLFRTDNEMVVQLSIPHISADIPFVPTVYDEVDIDPACRLYDALTQPALECRDDAAATNVTDHLQRMAAEDDYYSDSASEELDFALDHLTRVCTAVVLRRAFMTMFTCLSALLLTSKHIAHAIREAFGYTMSGSVQWLLNKMHKLWHKPVISAFCPSMTNNAEQYHVQVEKFHSTGAWPFYNSQPGLLSIARLTQWVEVSSFDRHGHNAWNTLSWKLRHKVYTDNVFWIYRQAKFDPDPDAVKKLIKQAIFDLHSATSSVVWRTAPSFIQKCSNTNRAKHKNAKLASEALFIQSACFTQNCLETVMIAKEIEGYCTVIECWCKAAIVDDLPMHACSMKHACILMRNEDQSTNEINIDHLRLYDEYDQFSTNLALHRYDSEGLLQDYHGSSFHRAKKCYNCANDIQSKATTTHKVSFCRQCWTESRPQCKLALSFHIDRMIRYSVSDSSSNSSFEEVGTPQPATIAAAHSYNPNGAMDSHSLSPPAFAQIDQNDDPLGRLRTAMNRKRYILEGDDWLARITGHYLSAAAKDTKRTRFKPKATQRWCPEYNEDDSMNTVMSSSVDSDEHPEGYSLTKWLQAKQNNTVSRNKSIIPVNSLPQHLKCLPSETMKLQNRTEINQTSLNQYFQQGLAVNQPQNKTH